MATKCNQCHRPATEKGRCELHASRPELAKQRSWRAGHKVYDSARWKRLRRLVLSQQPLCQVCYNHGYISEAVDVDHIESVRRSPELAFERRNLMAMCKACHSRKTAQERRGSV